MKHRNIVKKAFSILKQRKLFCFLKSIKIILYYLNYIILYCILNSQRKSLEKCMNDLDSQHAVIAVGENKKLLLHTGFSVDIDENIGALIILATEFIA